MKETSSLSLLVLLLLSVFTSPAAAALGGEKESPRELSPTSDMVCPDPAAFCCGLDEGTSCESEDKCLKDSYCDHGECVGGEPKLCSPPTQCKTASCDPDSGCVFEDKPNGEPCDDGDASTVGEACYEGECTCTGPCCGIADGTPCDPGNECIKDPVCSQGQCVGTTKICTPPTQCKRVVGECIPETGFCTFEHLENGTPCDDGKDTTIDDKCLDGFCVGTCTGPCCGKPDGTACNTGNKCRKDSKCVDEVCKGRLKICTAPTTCKVVVGRCNSSTGFCTFKNKPDGTACRGGTCSAGLCVRK